MVCQAHFRRNSSKQKQTVVANSRRSFFQEPPTCIDIPPVVADAAVPPPTNAPARRRSGPQQHLRKLRERELSGRLTKRTKMPLRRCRTRSVPPPFSPLLDRHGSLLQARGPCPGKTPARRTSWLYMPFCMLEPATCPRAPNITGDRVLASAIAFGNSHFCCEMHPQSLCQVSPRPCLQSPSVRLMTFTAPLRRKIEHWRQLFPPCPTPRCPCRLEYQFAWPPMVIPHGGSASSVVGILCRCDSSCGSKQSGGRCPERAPTTRHNPVAAAAAATLQRARRRTCPRLPSRCRRPRRHCKCDTSRSPRCSMACLRHSGLGPRAATPGAHVAGRAALHEGRRAGSVDPGPATAPRLV